MGALAECRSALQHTSLLTLSPATLCSLCFLPKKALAISGPLLTPCLLPAMLSFLLSVYISAPPPPHPSAAPRPPPRIPQAPLKPNLSSEILLDFPNPQSACPPVSCVHASIPCLLLSIWPALPSFDIYLSLFSVFIFYNVPYLMLSFDYKLEERGVSSDFLYTQFLEQDLEHRYAHKYLWCC